MGKRTIIWSECCRGGLMGENLAMADVSIRTARAADRAAIESIAGEVVAAGADFVYRAVADVLEYFYAPGGALHVALRGQDVVGVYVVKPNQKGRGDHVANAGYMVRLDQRGRGLGRALGEHSLDVARALGFAAMQFNMVVSTNVHAVSLWRDLGFEVVGTLPAVFRHANGETVDAFVMHRTL
jgi:ribosomal protein S18 acetylase RimI-like enzyme